ncbi:hypothetical protein IG631_03534 [Alternaria alternata]|nr:hypothetical protein IG631_03534 [Alternaria alternata]
MVVAVMKKDDTAPTAKRSIEDAWVTCIYIHSTPRHTHSVPEAYNPGCGLLSGLTSHILVAKTNPWEEAKLVECAHLPGLVPQSSTHLSYFTLVLRATKALRS